MNNSNLWLLFSFFIVISYSCTTTVTNVSDIGLKDGEYDRDVFQVETNNRLEILASSVKMLNCLAYYESYLFDKRSGIKLNNLSEESKKAAIAVNHSTETSSGTATIIYSHKGKVALLTCAHIIDFPDTLITYFKDSQGLNTKVIERISIKTRQSNLLPELSVSNEVEILSIDPVSDIAIIGRNVTKLNSSKFIPFGLKLGNSNELSWGTTIYIIGYPLNNKMITTGLVSPSQVNGKDYFFVDAIFNRGFSGGVVLAVRDGAPNFELVGMVKSGTVHRHFNLIPNSDDPDFSYHPKKDYGGEILVEERGDIKYGVTRIMTVEKIIDFIENSKTSLEDSGFIVSQFLND